MWDLFILLSLKKENPRDVAKERLKLVLIHDRFQCISPVFGDGKVRSLR